MNFEGKVQAFHPKCFVQAKGFKGEKVVLPVIPPRVKRAYTKKPKIILPDQVPQCLCTAADAYLGCPYYIHS